MKKKIAIFASGWASSFTLIFLFSGISYPLLISITIFIINFQYYQQNETKKPDPSVTFFYVYKQNLLLPLKQSPYIQLYSINLVIGQRKLIQTMLKI